jgi:hypothetical protein
LEFGQDLALEEVHLTLDLIPPQRLAGSALAKGLAAEERTERLATEHGLAALGQRLGVNALRYLLHADDQRDALKRIEGMISRRSAEAPRERRSQQTTTTALRREQ